MIRYIEYDMEDFFRSCVEKYCELARKRTGQTPKLKHATTPFIDEGIRQSTDFAAPNREKPKTNEMNKEASAVLMKILYGARMARFDLLRATCALAANVTRWTTLTIRNLHDLFLISIQLCRSE